VKTSRELQTAKGPVTKNCVSAVFFNHGRKEMRIVRNKLALTMGVAFFIAMFLLGAGPRRATAQSCGTNESILCGQTLARALLSDPETDCFLFTADAGEVVSVTTARVEQFTGPSFDPCWQLYRANGALVVHADGSEEACCGQCESVPLPANETYTIKVFEATHNATGNYNISLEAVSATFNGAVNCAQPIACGQTLPGQLDGPGPGETDTFRFTAGAGEVASITTAMVEKYTGPSFDPCWRLFRANGVPVDRADGLGSDPCCGQCESVPLPGNETYTIKVFEATHNATGSYNLTLEVANCQEPTDCDQDGIEDVDDVCPCVAAPLGVDAFGRSLGDLDGDCDVDLDDYRILQGNFTGPGS